MAQMDLSEEIKQYISLVQSLPLEIRNISGSSEVEEQTAVQGMGTLLASNCQKICIGPSFHLYPSENKDMDKDKLDRNTSPSPDVEDDDEEYETIIYNGPDMQYHSLKSLASSTKQYVNRENAATDPCPIPMNVRLAQVAAQYGGLLSPSFFCRSPETSSTSSKDAGYSSEISSASSDLKSSDDSGSVKCEKMPFHFPKVTNSARCHFDSNLPQAFERVEIVDDVPSDESNWVEWPMKYVEEKGFRLGIQPGDFFKSKTGRSFYVKLPHRSKYEILVTNGTQVLCDVDLYVNGKIAIALRLPAGASRSIDGPSYSEHAFTCFRSKDAPPELGIKEGDPRHGIVKAVFTPEKIENARLRAISEPMRKEIPGNDILDVLDDPAKKKTRSFTTSEQENVERSLDMNSVVEAVTLLQGKKKKQNLVRVAEIETDLSKRVTLQFRIIASLTEEVEASDEKVYCLEPPPIPSRR